MSMLAFANVDACYGRAKILHEVTFAIEAHERVAILGRNGVGKTTVVNAFVGIATVPRGEIVLAGRRPSRIRHFTAARLGVAVVPQGRRIVPTLSVRENLMLGAAVGRRGPWNLERIGRLFPVLAERAHLPGPALSGGQQQMLAIGRALMANPSLLVLDEPSEGLAPVIVDELAEALLQLNREGTGLLLIEQSHSLVRRVATRYYVMSKGTIIEQGDLAGLSLEALRQHVAV